jgi:O-antigen ligase
MVAVVAALLFVQIYKLATQRLRLPLYAIILPAILMIAAGATVLVTQGEQLTGALGRSSDLTGRTEIWSRVMYYIPERPILGYGYSGFWYGASPESIAIDRAMGQSIMYSHNGYLETLLNLGAVGFVFLLIFLGAGIKRAFYASKRNQSNVDFWPIAFLFFFILHNFGECTILFQDLEWAVCVATVVGTQAALFAPYAQPQEESLFVTCEEFT